MYSINCGNLISSLHVRRGYEGQVFREIIFFFFPPEDYSHWNFSLILLMILLMVLLAASRSSAREIVGARIFRMTTQVILCAVAIVPFLTWMKGNFVKHLLFTIATIVFSNDRFLFLNFLRSNFLAILRIDRLRLHVGR